MDYEIFNKKSNNSKIIVGREREQKLLSNILESRKAEFVAVYGRRRVGKTYLVKTFFKKANCIFFHIAGTKDAGMPEQISDFMRVLETVFYNGEFKIKEPKNWKEAFELLTSAIKRQPKNRKIVLFFDELPWLSSRRSLFIQSLDYYWNRYWSDMPQIKLIVCGSAASWMHDNLISHKGGLHNRISKQIVLYPFNLSETYEFLKFRGVQYSISQVIEVFMVTGGIPYYLNFINGKLSVAKNIDLLCFRADGELFSEFGRLYSSLFDSPKAYEELIRIIASKKSGISRTDILKKTKHGSDGGRLAYRLEALERSGFIVSFVPYGFVKKGTYFRVIDEYSLFYMNWIEPILSNIKKIDRSKGYWLDMCKSPAWRTWAGYAFEAICLKHIDELRSALDVSAAAKLGSWQYIPKNTQKNNKVSKVKNSKTKPAPNTALSGAQIDLLFDDTDNIITICEIKYSASPYQLTKELARELLDKIQIFKSRNSITKQINIALITNTKIKRTMYSEELIASNVSISAKGVFR